MVATDCFLPFCLSYNDLSTCVVEEVAEVAIVMEAGEVKGEATRCSSYNIIPVIKSGFSAIEIWSRSRFSPCLKPLANVMS